jgi:hypothetical protein
MESALTMPYSLIPSHGGGMQRLRPLPRRLIREMFVQWTAPDADPQWALPALLSLIHAVPPGRLRQMRVADVFKQDGQLRLRGMPELAEPAREALANFLDWRAAHYVGPSTYLLVTRANRFIDRPIGDHVLRKQAYRNHPSVGMAQAAIRELIDAGSDPLDLQAFTGLGVATIEAYLLSEKHWCRRRGACRDQCLRLTRASTSAREAIWAR